MADAFPLRPPPPAGVVQQGTGCVVIDVTTRYTGNALALTQVGAKKRQASATWRDRVGATTPATLAPFLRSRQMAEWPKLFRSDPPTTHLQGGGAARDGSCRDRRHDAVHRQRACAHAGGRQKAVGFGHSAGSGGRDPAGHPCPVPLNPPTGRMADAFSLRPLLPPAGVVQQGTGRVVLDITTRAAAAHTRSRDTERGPKVARFGHLAGSGGRDHAGHPCPVPPTPPSGRMAEAFSPPTPLPPAWVV
jgi:hypothetical protein